MKTLITIFYLTSVAAFADIPATVEIGDFQVTHHTLSIFKQSITLRDIKSGRMINVDCLDGRQPTNSIMTILPGVSFEGTPAHEIFNGLTDFYCSGLSAMTKGVKVGDQIQISFEVSLLKEVAGGQSYQIAIITDIQFIVAGQARSWKKIPAIVRLSSKEPIL